MVALSTGKSLPYSEGGVDANINMTGNDPRLCQEGWKGAWRQGDRTNLLTHSSDLCLSWRMAIAQAEQIVAGLPAEDRLLEAVTVRLIQSDEERVLHDELLDQEHYLHNANAVGRMLR